MNAWIIPPLGFVATSPHTAIGDPAYVGNDYAGVVWRSGVLGGPYLLLDLGSDQAIDTVAMFGLIGADMAGTLCQVFAATSAEGEGTRPRGSGAQALLAGSAMPVSGRGMALAVLPADWPPVRYLTVEFALPSGSIEVSRVVVGRRIALERNFSFGATFGVRDLGSLDFNRRGVLQRARGRKLRTTALTFSSVYREEVEILTGPLLERIGNTEMVALVTDPAAHAQRQNRMYYGPLVGDLAHTQRKAQLFEAKTNMVSIF